MKKLLLSVAALATILTYSCKKGDDGPQHTFRSSDVAIGNGKARTIIETDDSNLVKSVSISFDKAALEGLPQDEHSIHLHAYSFKMALPSQKAGTPFDHVLIDWAPKGHTPAGVYDKAHFDLHFYSIADSDRLSIPEYATDSTGFQAFPAPAYLPQNYVPIPGGEEKMGKHWADITSPELAQPGTPFTQTFIYGTYGGKVAFLEPMVTLDYLKSTTGFTRPIPQPAKFSKSGFYPTQMSITDKGATMEVSLHTFVYRAGS